MSNYTEGFTSVAGDVIDDTELEAEFDKIATAVNSKIDADGSGTMSGDLNMGSQNITSLADPTADQDAATKSFVENAEVSDFATIGTTTISTVEVREGTVGVTIPSDWNGYFVELIATAYITETTPTSGSVTVNIRLREDDGTAGTLLGQTNAGVGDAVPNNVAPIAVHGFLENQTTTGAIIFSLTTETSANSLDLSLTGCSWRVRARRTS